MAAYKAQVEIANADPAHRVVDEWEFDAPDDDRAKIQANGQFIDRKTVHLNGTLRVTRADGTSFSRPFPQEDADDANWT